MLRRLGFLREGLKVAQILFLPKESAGGDGNIGLPCGMNSKRWRLISPQKRYMSPFSGALQDLTEHLEEVIRTLDESFYDSFKPVFVSDVPEVCASLAVEFNAPVLEMPVQEFARGVQQFIEGRVT